MNLPTSAIADPAPTSSHAVAGVGLYRYAVGVVVAVFLLIKVGAMVTSTGSGLAFEDWPLSDGSWWPPDMRLDQLLEHGHRAVGMAIGLLTLVLTIWIGVVERRQWLRSLSIGLLGLVCLQGYIGGKGVLLGLPAVTSVTHGVLAQVILCLLALVAFALSPAWASRHPAAAHEVATARNLSAFALMLVFVQLVAGAILRHTNAQGMLWLHIFNAVVVALTIAIAAMYCGTRFGDRGFRGTTRWVLVLLLVQLVLGFVALLVRRVKDPSNIEYLGRSVLVTAHVVVGALLFLSAALLLYRTCRNLKPIP